MVAPQVGCSTLTPPPPPSQIQHTSSSSSSTPSNNINLTSPHSNMTPSPTNPIISNNQPPPSLNLTLRNPTTPPMATNFQPQLPIANYQKYYPPVPSPNLPQNYPRSRISNPGNNNNNIMPNNSLTAPHIQAGGPLNRVSPLNPNLVAPYAPMNSYRMPTQQHSPASVSGYLAANSPTGFNPPPLPMGVLNMSQSQYQDPTMLHRAAAAQQNPMYPSYNYINSGFMQSLNGSTRR